MKKIKMFRGHDSYLIEDEANEFLKGHQDIIVEDIRININPNSHIFLTILYEEK